MPFVLMSLVFLAVLWFVWALLWLFWPLALLVGGIFLWRGQMRHWQRISTRSEAPRRFTSPPRSSSGNAAFDEYREEALHRIDEEQGKFREFLERLRRSKDKQEFDQFMSNRRPRPALPPATA
jgi:hypothetical protein